MTLGEKITERGSAFVLALFLAIFGWAWNLNERVSALELHQQYTAASLGAIERKVDALDAKLTLILRLQREEP